MAQKVFAKLGLTHYFSAQNEKHVIYLKFSQEGEIQSEVWREMGGSFAYISMILTHQTY